MMGMGRKAGRRKPTTISNNPCDRTPLLYDEEGWIIATCAADPFLSGCPRHKRFDPKVDQPLSVIPAAISP